MGLPDKLWGDRGESNPHQSESQPNRRNQYYTATALQVGLEPTTSWLTVKSSTNWATGEFCESRGTRTHIRQGNKFSYTLNSADAVGFEPTVGITPRQINNLVYSATLSHINFQYFKERFLL